MLLNPQFAQLVLDAWIVDQEHPYRGREKRDYPDKKRVAEILDIAFQVSMQNEEGQPVRGAIALLSPDELEQFEIHKRRETPLVVKFAKPRQLEVEVVAKLINVTDVNSSSLLIGRFNDEYKIWGIIYFTKKREALNDIPAELMECRHFRPDCLNVEVVGAGSLMITRQETVIGRIENGEFKPAVPTVFHSQAMGPALYGLFNIKIINHKFASDGDSERELMFFSCLEYLLWKIDNQYGGATVIFIHENSLQHAHEYMYMPWECIDGLEMYKLICARLKYYREQNSKEVTSFLVLRADEILRQRLDSIAKLASLDGALLLTQRFDLIGFGVKLEAEKYDGEVREGPDAFNANGEIIDFSRFGTRHNSALNFVASIPGSVGFVASEDGPIRSLVKISDQLVHCWLDCRHSKFVQGK